MTTVLSAEVRECELISCMQENGVSLVPQSKVWMYVFHCGMFSTDFAIKKKQESLYSWSMQFFMLLFNYTSGSSKSHVIVNNSCFSNLLTCYNSWVYISTRVEGYVF